MFRVTLRDVLWLMMALGLFTIWQRDLASWRAERAGYIKAKESLEQYIGKMQYEQIRASSPPNQTRQTALPLP